jgi:hypothetical protein
VQLSHHEAAHLAALGRQWIAAWNSHDLERVLALYAEDSEMTSDRMIHSTCFHCLKSQRWRTVHKDG